MNENENIKFDCSRGCTVTRDASDQLVCLYRQGCCKLADYDYFKGVRVEKYASLFEVRFKNTRKGIYRNDSGQNIKTGDLVIVEAQSGHDLGIVTLEGPVVGRQMVAKGITDPATLKKIYRKAKTFDIDKWQEAIAREQSTMIRARQIAVELGLDMKIGDVEFQGDGTKAIFYYIADGRVDFRQLIKVFAEEFRIRVEMKQIGARQEAGLIGGLGVCGRELCCANYITSFKSITTAAARTQDLSLNPQKLAGQCGKLKCCLNYEVSTYLDAQSRIPKVSGPLELEDGPAFLVKTDILAEKMYFSYEKGSLALIYPLSAGEVTQILEANARGEVGRSLKEESPSHTPEFFSAVGEGSITRFDKPKKGKNKSKKNKGQAQKDGPEGSAQPKDQATVAPKPQGETPSSTQPKAPTQNPSKGQGPRKGGGPQQQGAPHRKPDRGGKNNNPSFRKGKGEGKGEGRKDQKPKGDA